MDNYHIPYFFKNFVIFSTKSAQSPVFYIYLLLIAISLSQIPIITNLSVDVTVAPPPPYLLKYAPLSTSVLGLIIINFYLFILIPAPALPPVLFPLEASRAHLNSSTSTIFLLPSSYSVSC